MFQELYLSLPGASQIAPGAHYLRSWRYTYTFKGTSSSLGTVVILPRMHGDRAGKLYRGKIIQKPLQYRLLPYTKVGKGWSREADLNLVLEGYSGFSFRAHL